MILEKTAYGTTTTDTCRREESLSGNAVRFSATHIKNLEDRSVTSTHDVRNGRNVMRVTLYHLSDYV